jgi:hypothetical protein
MRPAVARSSRLGVLLATLAFSAAMSIGTATAQPSTRTGGHSSGSVVAAAPGTCPAVMPLAHVHAGQVGTGWTVVRGHTPRPFVVNILGILPDGVAPGRDIIMVKLSDKPGSHFIKKAGGLWAGISGSPVYVNHQLVGSVSWGFTASPSPIGGLTPAEDIVKVLDYGTGSADRSTFAPVHAALPQSTRDQVARMTGMTAAEVSSFDRMRLPLAVSGLSAHGRELFQKELDRAGYQVIVTPGASAAAPTGATFQTPKPGGNFAGLLAYGDITAGGIGTTTYVCAGQALAFGHPLSLVGPATFGANNANALAIIRDNTFGSYKLATIGGLFGMLDQDRLSAVRAQLGVVPNLIPIISDVKSVDSGNERIGETDATTDDIVPGIAPFHLYANIVSTVDAEAAGSSLVHWTVQGHDGDGNAWSLSRTNRFASTGDIPFESIFELQDDLFSILGNQFTDVTFDSVNIDASVTSKIKMLDIEKVLISKNGGAFAKRTSMNLHPGDNLTIRVTLRRYHADTKTVDLAITVPPDAVGSGGLLIAGGATFGGPCGFGKGVPGRGVVLQPTDTSGGSCGQSFQKLLDALAGARMNNDLYAEIDLFGTFGGVKTVAEDTMHQGGVVSGNREIIVNITP